MRMTPEAFSDLRGMVNGVLADMPHIVPMYESGDFPRADRVQDLNKRFRWDVWHYLGRTQRDKLVRIAGGLDDAHIDTALRRLVPTIVQRFDIIDGQVVAHVTDSDLTVNGQSV